MSSTVVDSISPPQQLDCWQYSPEKQARLRDQALAKILIKSCKAGYAGHILRLGREVLARDSKKTGFFPGRLVVHDKHAALPKVAKDHVRVQFDGRPQEEYRDLPSSLIHYLPHRDDYYWGHNNLLSPWVLLDDLHNFENTPLMAYAKVFERTEFTKIRVLLCDGNFELVDRRGRVVKVRPEWVHRHSTVHPDAIKEAVQEAEKDREQFLELPYGASHYDQKKKAEESQQQSTTRGPPIRHTNQDGDCHWLPASLASAIHVYADAQGIPPLKDCAQAIYVQGKQLPMDSRFRARFQELVNRIAHPMGYRMEALRFFNPLHDCSEAGAAPVVASIVQGNGYGRCVSFYGDWVVDPSLSHARERTEKGMQQLYGKGESYNKSTWSYCWIPLRANLRNSAPQQNPGGLFKRKSRSRKRSRGKNHNYDATTQVPDKRSKYY